MQPLIATIFSGYAMRLWSVAVVVAGVGVWKHFWSKRHAAEHRVMTVLITGAGGKGKILQRIRGQPLQLPKYLYVAHDRSLQATLATP